MLFNKVEKPEDKLKLTGIIDDSNFEAFVECSIVASTLSSQLLETTLEMLKAINSRVPNPLEALQRGSSMRSLVGYVKMNYLYIYENLRKRHLVASVDKISDQEQYNATHERFERLKLQVLRILNDFKSHGMITEGTIVTDLVSQATNILNYGFFMFVEGSAFSGKTRFLTQYLDTVDQKTTIVKVDINKAVETLSLVGNYVLKSENGLKKFEWVDGPLVRLLKDGGILVLENLEMANDELKAFIKHFILTDHVKVRNKKIYRDARFRLILTSRLHMDMQTTAATLRLEDKSQIVIVKEHVDRLFEGHGSVSFVKNLLNILLEEYNNPYHTKKHLRFVKRCLLTVNNIQMQPNGVPKFISTLVKLAISFDVIDMYCDGHIDSFIESISYPQICNLLKASTQEMNTVLHSYSLDITSKSPNASSRFPIPLSFNQPSSSFVYTHKNAVELEKISGCIYYNENVLLVGETGAGKTAIVQELARMSGAKLHVFNLSESTDASDLFGGYKPINRSLVLDELINRLEVVNANLFSSTKNTKFFINLRTLVAEQKQKICLKCIQQLAERFLNTIQDQKNEVAAQLIDIIRGATDLLVHGFAKDVSFEFVKGMLWNAIEKGEWVLLDEVNLAPEEVLLRLEQVLSSDRIYLTEANDIRVLEKPAEFRLFACMNPAFEVGKKPLPPIVEENFTRIEFEPIETFDEVYRILKGSLSNYPIVTDKFIQSMAQIYIKLKEMARDNEVLDKSDKKCVFSLRQLKRSLEILKVSVDNPVVQLTTVKAIYMSLRIAFMLDLNENSRKIFNREFAAVFESPKMEANYKQEDYLNLKLEVKDSTAYSVIYNHPFKAIGESIKLSDKVPYHGKYTITPTIKENIFDLLRILMFTKEVPLLLEGPTSTGKTSVIKFLADMTGNKLVRINNHRDMDLDEYVGRYEPKEHTVEFVEGKLLECMRNGYWLLLDELNLARSEILEALNRVFDDNRELYIPELGEFVRPSPAFRIFATQNPANYSGRALLSKAFRNRFICVNWDNLKDIDLEQILNQRCQLPKSRTGMLLSIKNQLQNLRSHDELLEGKHGLITVRDLLKWSLRATGSKEEVVMEGYSLLAERIREYEQREIVQAIMKEHAQIKNFEIQAYYDSAFDKLITQYPVNDVASNMGVKLTDEFRKTIILIANSFMHKESVLLVGETGTGKTTIAQFMSQMLNLEFFYINCHKGTEVSDFLGGWRPVRHKAQTKEEIMSIVGKYTIDEALIEEVSESAEDLKAYMKENEMSITPEDATLLEACVRNLEKDFEWVDGSLVHAVRNGGIYLVDEISLASDSVLERLNSLLESERKLMVKEGEIEAHPNFIMIATMNPSGDHGKRELSPALRNRFTEIWVPSPLDAENFADVNLAHKAKSYLKSIVETKIIGSSESFLDLAIELVFRTFRITNFEQKDLFKPLNLRDLENLYFLINSNNCTEASLGLAINMVFESSIGLIKDDSLRKYALAIKAEFFKEFPSIFHSLGQTKQIVIDHNQGVLRVENVSIDVNPSALHILNDYILDERYVIENLFKILVGLQSNKALLLEGPPGVGKTSLIQTLAKLKEVPLYRINMSEQTDIIDLLGTDVPDPNKVGAFKWSDGVLLRSLKNGGWVIIDELNLANQTVLEGLNSILDYRGEIYLPDLNIVVKKHPDFRLFGTQNPDDFGKGRKGLPLSFLNRFFRIYIEETPMDAIKKILRKITENRYPDLTVFDGFFSFVFSLVEKKILDPIVFNIRFFRKVLQFLNKYYNGNNIDLVQWMAYITFVLDFEHDKEKRVNLHAIYEAVFESQNITFTFDKGTLTLFNSKDQQLVLNTVGNIYNVNPKPDFFESELMYSLSTVIDLGMPCIISTESQEKSILQTLSDLSKAVGKRVRMLQLYKTADNADLIGGYDQSYSYDEFNGFIKRIEKTGDSMTVLLLKECRGLPLDELIASLNELASQVQNPSSLYIIQSYSEDLKKCQAIFEWVDSELIKAIEKGDWIVIKGCDRVSSSVLEKLNGLLEDEEILVNECIENDEVRKIKKSPGFRIFLLFKHAQPISNALKNRCVLMNLDNFGSEAISHKSFAFDYLRDAEFINQLKTETKLSPSNTADLSSYREQRVTISSLTNKVALETMFRNSIKVVDTSSNYTEYQLGRFLDSLIEKHAQSTQDHINGDSKSNGNGNHADMSSIDVNTVYSVLSDILNINQASNGHSLNTGNLRSLNPVTNYTTEERFASYICDFIDLTFQRLLLDTSANQFLTFGRSNDTYRYLEEEAFVKQIRFLSIIDSSILDKIYSQFEVLKHEVRALTTTKTLDYTYQSAKNLGLSRVFEIVKNSQTVLTNKSESAKHMFFTYMDGDYNETRRLYISTSDNDQLLAALMLNSEVLNFNDLGDVSMAIQDKFENAYVFAQQLTKLIDLHYMSLIKPKTGYETTLELVLNYKAGMEKSKFLKELRGMKFEDFTIVEYNILQHYIHTVQHYLKVDNQQRSNKMIDEPIRPQTDVLKLLSQIDQRLRAHEVGPQETAVELLKSIILIAERDISNYDVIADGVAKGYMSTDGEIQIRNNLEQVNRVIAHLDILVNSANSDKIVFNDQGLDMGIFSKTNTFANSALGNFTDIVLSSGSTSHLQSLKIEILDFIKEAHGVIVSGASLDSIRVSFASLFCRFVEKYQLIFDSLNLAPLFTELSVNLLARSQILSDGSSFTKDSIVMHSDDIEARLTTLFYVADFSNVTPELVNTTSNAIDKTLAGLNYHLELLKDLDSKKDRSAITVEGKLLKLEDGMKKVSNFEYTKASVEEQKLKEKQQIKERFNTYREDFDDFLKQADFSNQHVDTELKTATRFYNEQALEALSLMSLRALGCNSIDFKAKSDWISFIKYSVEDLNKISSRLQNILINKELEIKSAGIDIWKSLVGTVQIPALLLTDSESSFLIGFIKETLKNLQIRSFYMDTNDYRHITAIQSILRRMMEPLLALLLMPELSQMPALSMMLKIIEKLSGFKMKTPLSKLCTALEIVYQSLFELNSLLPRDLKLAAFEQEILKMMNELRKVEKREWKCMLALNLQELALQDLPKILNIKKIMNDSPTLSLVNLLDEFIQGSSLHNFKLRLFCIHEYTRDIQDPKLRGMVLNLVSYYLHFMDVFEKKVKESVQNIEEPMNKIMKLTNWYFEDIVNLKMNVEKLYRGINRCIKRQSDVYCDSANIVVLEAFKKSAIHNESAPLIRELAVDLSQKQMNDKEVVSTTLLKLIISSHVVFSLEDISFFRYLSPNKLYRLSTSSKNAELSTMKFNNCFINKDELKTFINTYMSRMSDLKETNNRSFKLRALTDFIKDMSIYVKTSRIIPEKSFTYPNMYGKFEYSKFGKPLIKFINQNGIINQFAAKLEKINIRTSHMIGFMRYLNENIVYNTEIPRTHQDRMIAIMFEMFMVFGENYKKLNGYIANVNQILEKDNVVESHIGTIKGQILLHLDNSMNTMVIEGQQTDQIVTIMTLINQEKWADAFEATRELNNSDLMEWVHAKLHEVSSLINSNVEESQLEAFEQSYQQLRRKFKASILKLEQNEDLDLFAKELKFTDLATKYTTKLLDLNCLPNNFSANHTELLRMDLTTKLAHTLDWVYNLNKLVYFITRVFYNLLYSGFCTKPDDPENEKCNNQEYEKELGTGMGEGKGEENVTGEMEFEEQLLGLKGEKPDEKDQDQPDEPKDKDAEKEEEMEMENDFDADKEEGADEEEQEKAEPNELDDDFGDVNDEDLNPKLDKGDDEDETKDNKDNKQSKFELEAQEIEKNREELKAKEDDENKETRQMKNEGQEMEEAEEEDANEDQSAKEEEADGEFKEEKFNDELPTDTNKPEQPVEDLELDNLEDKESEVSQGLEEEIVEQASDDDDAQVDEDIPVEDNLNKKDEKPVENMQLEENQAEILGDDIDEQGQENNAEGGANNQPKDEETNEAKDNDPFRQIIEQKKADLQEQLSKYIEDARIEKSNNDAEVNLDSNVFEATENKGYKTRGFKQDVAEEEDNNQQEDQKKDDAQNKGNRKDDQIDKMDEELKKRNLNEDEMNIEDLPVEALKKTKTADDKKLRKFSEAIDEFMKTFEPKNGRERGEIEEMFSDSQIYLTKEANRLCEHLKNIIEQRRFSGLKGDYKTGKRINMKRIISYIASNYRKDKIWMRRSEPNQKDYRILLALDNSASMKEKNVGQLALFSFSMLAEAIVKSQVGDLFISSIDSDMNMLYKDRKEWNWNVAADIFAKFDFEYKSDLSGDLSMANFVKQGNEFFGSFNDDKLNMCFIISDGRINKNIVRPYIVEAEQQNYLYFFIILDKEEYSDSILNYKTTDIVYSSNGVEVNISNYLDDFPFRYYVIVKNIKQLADLVTKVIQEYFEKHSN